MVKDPTKPRATNRLSKRHDLLTIVDMIEDTPDLGRLLGFNIEEAPKIEASKVELSKVFDDAKYRGANLDYEYDFGDYWLHEIKVLGRGELTNRFVCLSGEGHGVAEDCGGHRGWNELLEAYRATNPSGQQLELREWFEESASNADPRGLGNGRDREWSIEEANGRLLQMAGFH
jgi:Plasmid pRiA4b ORF-3-like protein